MEARTLGRCLPASHCVSSRISWYGRSPFILNELFSILELIFSERKPFSMSHSVPSESSALDATFLVGVDLIEFDRRDLPIYLKPQTPWAEACVDEDTYGAPLDRVFGEPGDIHLDGIAHAPDQQQEAGIPAVGDDPLILHTALSDGLMLSMPEPSAAPAAPEATAAFDFGADAHAVVHLDDGASWNAADGTFDFLA